MSDFIFITQWWFIIFLLGAVFYPLTSVLFPTFYDKGYLFSKTIGIAFLSYTVFIVGILKILPFTQTTLYIILAAFLLLNLFIIKTTQQHLVPYIKSHVKMIMFEECIFFVCLAFWSYVKAHEPNIYGLEKFMDYGFVNSILRSRYFPPLDMWYSQDPINYYYFGHLTAAVLIKFSGIASNIAYNLMIAMLFAFAFTGAFSIVFHLVNKTRKLLGSVSAGLLGGILVALSGNLQIIYSFFTPYPNPENPVPFWQLLFSPSTFPNNYWYPNATRFIPFTIHEFPIYSFVVSDLHGHVIDIPFVLLTIALLLSLIFNFQFSIFNQIKISKNSNSFQISNFKFQILLISFLLAIMYMTNAWDGIIYFLLAALVLLFLCIKQGQTSYMEIKNEKLKIKNSLKIENYKLKIILWLFYLSIIIVGFILFSLPFSIHFKPFISGIGVVCAPDFLVKFQKLGPFLFEPNHCQKSAWWQLLILYGFFYFFIISFIIFLLKIKPFRFAQGENQKSKSFKNLKFIENLKLKIENLTTSDIFVLILILLSTLLIIIPEFIYIKDIYPAHYRANTMFKLVYQAFIMLSLSSAYIIVRVISNIKNQILKIVNLSFIYFICTLLFLILVLVYPYFAVNSYFGNLKVSYGLDGLYYLRTQQPYDYQAVSWINSTISEQPVLLEAQGDSYTMYERISANTGLPTVIGWGVHEWLWRGTYDIVAPRIADVKQIYESQDLEQTKLLLSKYNVSHLYIGRLEHEKYPLLNEYKFNQLGEIIYQNPGAKIYKIRN